MEVTTREAAERLRVNQSRVRALVAAGTLEARRVGSQWLIDADSVDRQAALTTAKATGRAMAKRVAWATGDLADGGEAAWLTAAERSRLRKRLREAASTEVLQKWLRSRSSQVTRYRVGEADLDELLRTDGVVATGVSAATDHGLGLGTGGDGDAYVDGDVLDRLVRDYFLIESRSGNLTLRLVEHNLHLLTARETDGLRVTTRLIVGVDLADDRDTRTRSAGRTLLDAVLNEQKRGR